MNKDKIAILVDSATNVPQNIIDANENIYLIPLKVIYSYGEFSDGIDITTEEIYSNLDKEIPSTSLPASNEIIKILDQIKADGYEKVLSVSISSGLSGTYNAIRIISNNYKELDIFPLDTKSITVGAGFHAIAALDYIKEGMDWDTLTNTLTKNIHKTKIFFTVSTLEYLQKGGRIGLVSSILGSTLNLKPVISCNTDGIYYTAAKVLGRKRSIRSMIKLAVDFASDASNYSIAIGYGGTLEQANNIKSILEKELPDAKRVIKTKISPVLGVHTGPGAIGIAIQKL